MDNKTNEALLGKDLFGEVVKPDIQGILKNKFLMPPFSVLSARDGTWQDRKRQWLALGIQSEVGRINDTDHSTMAKTSAGMSLEIRERIEQSGSGTSVFDPVLCELMYDWFCPPNGQVIDPFCGGSARGIVASVMKRDYWGCDLRQEQIDANYEQIGICVDTWPVWVGGDALDRVAEAPIADFVFTCPPYGNLEVYSEDPRDISTMDYPKFMSTLTRIIKLSVDKLKPKCYACIVVGDFRDKKGYYHNFVSDTIGAFLQAGTKLYNEIILVTAVGSLPIRITKQFEAGRKVGKTHQNVLVFYKP